MRVLRRTERVHPTLRESFANEPARRIREAHRFHVPETRAHLDFVTEPSRFRQESIVDKNRTEGIKHEIKGAVKEVAGKVTGNKTKEAAGAIEKNAGKVQKEVGKAADEVRDAQRKR
jgi:uncharacterized protein YjbJ (UPF0337 family)